jgi:membrane-associated PAP2 superfamily phosphatase
MSNGSAAKLRGVRRFFADLAGSPATPSPARTFLEWAAPLALAATITIWVRWSGFDLAAQDWIHRLGGDSWRLGEHPFWKGLYDAGTLPAAFVVFGAMSLYAWSWRKVALRPWRKVSGFLVLNGIIGPGIITNALLKEYWGRPRPRELVNFGGRSEFEPVLTYDATSGGLSFPCGHATMGFYFLAFYFLVRGRRPDLAQGILFGSLVLGGLMGIARMTQGGHFFSDVVWSAVVCWYTPLILAKVLRFEETIVSITTAEPRPVPLPLKIAFSVVGAGVLAGVLLATPYREKRTHTLKNAFAQEGLLTVRLSLELGELEIVPGEEFRILADANGHGIPTSKIGRNYLETQTRDGAAIDYTERVSGWLNEVNASVRVELPWARMRRLKLDTGNARVRIVTASTGTRPLIELSSGEGEVAVESNGQVFAVEPPADARLSGPVPAQTGEPGASPYRIELGEAFSGRLGWGSGNQP